MGSYHQYVCHRFIRLGHCTAEFIGELDLSAIADAGRWSMVVCHRHYPEFASANRLVDDIACIVCRVVVHTHQHGYRANDGIGDIALAFATRVHQSRVSTAAFGTAMMTVYANQQLMAVPCFTYCRLAISI